MEGVLAKNPKGRWEIVNSSNERLELTAGDWIQVIVAEKYSVTTRIEFNTDYYAVTPGVKLYIGQEVKFIPRDSFLGK